MLRSRILSALVLSSASLLACQSPSSGGKASSDKRDKDEASDVPAKKAAKVDEDDDDDAPKKRAKKADAPADESPSAKGDERPDYDACLAKGRSLVGKKNYDGAIAAFDDAIAQKRDATALGERGYAKVLAKRWDGAIEDLDAAIAKTDDAKLLGAIWFNLGLAREGKGDEAGAAAAYRKSNALRPTEQAKHKLEALDETLACRAKKGDGTAIELWLHWQDGGIATGRLVVGATSTPVAAQLYKGLTLVDAAGTQTYTGKLATVTSEGTAQIRLGDEKQPWFDCAATPSAPSAPTVQEVAAFLTAMGRATHAKDAAFFTAHVRFPLTIKAYVYDMEGRIRQKTFATSGEMLKAAADWQLPAPFLAAIAKSPDARHGEPDCKQSDDAKLIDYAKGARAIRIDGAGVTVSILAESCGAEEHSETYELEADGGGQFRIVKITATN